MATKVIDPKLGEELSRLYAQLAEAHTHAAAAAGSTEAPGHIMEGAALARWVEAEAKVSAIVRRIREIQDG